MRKSVVLRYKDVFDFWLNGGKVWYLSPITNKWALKSDLTWGNDGKKVVYVQDDDMVEYRKAEAEGKQLQGMYYNSKEWFNITTKDTCFVQRSLGGYRVKPKGIKKWQWVCVNECDGKYKITGNYYATKEDAQGARTSCYWTVTEKYPLSEKEFDGCQ